MSLIDKLSGYLPSFKKEEHPEYFFALSIEENNLEASVWSIQGKKLRIVNTSSTKYESSDDLIDRANFVLDAALGDFPFEPNKILFGVPDSWLQDDDLKPEYLKNLKQLVKEIDVTPMAYVSTTHAISHYLQKLDGVPVTAILVGTSDPLVVTVVKAGKVVSSKTQKRTGNLPEDIEKALISFTDIEVLPSKILIYGDGNLDKFKQELLGYSWMSQLPFLHLPRVDGLEEKVEIKSISFAGASELNPDIHLKQGDLDMEKQENSNTISKPLKYEEHDNLRKPRGDDEGMGFVAGDIEEGSRVKGQVLRNGRGEETAFGEGADFEDEDEMMGETALPAPRKQIHPEGFEDNYPKALGGGVFAAASGVLAPILKISAASNVKFFILPVIIVTLLLIGGVFLPKAKVTVFVDPRTLENSATVIADPAVSAVDENAKLIPGKTVEVDISGSQKANATGKKQIGDPAKGKVIVYNATSKSVNLNKGTVLQTDDGKKFTLNNSVQVASKSASAADPPSKSDAVDATASEIGPDGNIAGGVDLKVSDFAKSDVVAKVDTAFSGGVSKDVTVVIADDQKKLLAALSADLRRQASDKIQEELTDGLKVLPEGLSEKITKQSFNKNPGDQSSEVNLNLTVNYKGTAYNENDLKLIVSKLVNLNVPEGYDLDLSKTETQADVAKIEKDGKLSFLAKFKAKLMPKLNTEEIKKRIAFKSTSEVEQILKSYENVVGGDVQMSPSLPGLLRRLPILPQNITVEIGTK